MKVVLDILGSALGAWSLSAHDFPHLDEPSATILGGSANLHQDPEREADGSIRLVFGGGRPTPYADRILVPDTESLWVYLYRPSDVEEMLRLEERIEPRYADYYAGVAAYYAGVFQVSGLGEGYLGEFMSFRRPIGAAREFTRSHEPPPDIVTIEDECRSVQGSDAARHILWLSRPGSDG